MIIPAVETTTPVMPVAALTPDQPSAKTPENVVTLKFTMPDPDQWTVEHYMIYFEGRQKYKATLLKNWPEIELLARYYGAVELIKRGIVKVEGPDTILRQLRSDDQRTTKLPLVGEVVRVVAMPIEGAFYIDPT